jgi:hypothetical protein
VDCVVGTAIFSCAPAYDQQTRFPKSHQTGKTCLGHQYHQTSVLASTSSEHLHVC